MIESKRPLKVFLCHAHADRDAVRALYNRLVKDGVDAWFDKEKLLPGQDWELEIRKAVRESDVVVVCLSKQFNQAGFRQKEVRLALDTAMEKPEGEIFIIPARLEECDNLESLRKWHWVDLFEDDGYEMLMRALRARADKIGAILQVKRNWLPAMAHPHPIQYQKVVTDTAEIKEEFTVLEDKSLPENTKVELQEIKRKQLRRQIPVTLIVSLFIICSIVLYVYSTISSPPVQPTLPSLSVQNQIYVAQIWHNSLTVFLNDGSVFVPKQGMLLNFEKGSVLQTNHDNGYVYLGLAGQTQLYLGGDTEIALKGLDDSQFEILLSKGWLLINQPDRRFLVDTPNGAHVWTGYDNNNAMIGLHYDIDTMDLYFDCLRGICFYADNQLEPEGFHSVLNGSTVVSLAPGIRNEYWQFVPSLVPTPTSTPSPNVPTNTAITATATKSP
jgi:hypothetical protein